MAEKESESTLARASKQFSTIAQDLFSIEVNIILRDNISAQKMPNPRHALLDIGKEYCAALEGMEMNRQDYNRDPNAKSLFFEEDMFEMMRQDLGFMTGDEFDERLRSKSVFDEVDEDKVVSHKVGSELGGFDAFDVLRTWADSLIDDENKYKFLDPAQLAVLPRIKDNADLIKGMYSAFCRRDPILNDPTKPEGNLEKLLVEREREDESRISPNTIVKLSKRVDEKRTKDLTNEYSRSDLVNGDDIEPLPIRDSDLMSIRKIWELGTEVIAMQTIVQIDGDVITRLNPNFLDETKYPRLHDYHNKGVNIALAHWSTLVNVAKELIVATVRGISGSLSE